jgi:hypothetical protein
MPRPQEQDQSIRSLPQAAHQRVAVSLRRTSSTSGCCVTSVTLWKVAPQDEESNVETFEQLLAHLASLSGKEQTAAIFDMLLFSVGGCDAYNYRVSPSVAKAAQLDGVSVEEVETRVRRGIMDQEAPQIPQDQRGESADSLAAVEPGNDATIPPEEQLDESEMPELQEAEDATADEAEEQPAGDEEAQQQEEEASTVAEAEEQPTVSAEAAQNPGEEQAEAQGTPKPPKPRSKADKRSARTKRAAITPPAKAAKKRTSKS